MQTVFDFLFLSEGELPFLLNSLRRFLDEAGYVTASANTDIKELSKIEQLPRLFILDAKTLNNNREVRVFLYDLCIENNKKIALIGETDELNELMKTSSSSVIAEVFERPINNKEVAERLGDIIEKAKEKSARSRILVVDDSPNFLRLISEWLDDEYCVDICPSATAAFRMIEANKPNLILLDYEMPVCNGAMFLEMIRNERELADIPVIFLTSRDDATTVRELVALKPQGYLLKNQDKKLILDSIRDFFKREQSK